MQLGDILHMMKGKEVADVYFKLKCSGDKNGCRRCVVRGIQCQYSGASKDRSRQRRRRPIIVSAVQESLPDSSDSSTNGYFPMQDDSAASPILHFYSPDTCGNSPAAFTNTVVNSERGTSVSVDVDTSPTSLDEVPTFSSTARDLLATDSTYLFPDLLWNEGPVALNWSYPSAPVYNHSSDYQRTSHNSTGDHRFLSVPTDSFLSTIVSKGQPESVATCNNSCIQTAVSHISELAMSSSINLNSISKTLKSTRAILSSLPSLLQCTPCSFQIPHLSLLLVISQHLIAAYEIILNILTVRFIELHPDPVDRIRLIQQAMERGQSLPASPSLQSTGSEDSPVTGECRGVDDDDAAVRGGDAKPETLLLGYEVDPTEEPCVFGGIVTLQLKRLMRFMSNLREVVERRERKAAVAYEVEGFVLLIQGVESRLLAQLWIVGTCGRIE